MTLHKNGIFVEVFLIQDMSMLLYEKRRSCLLLLLQSALKKLLWESLPDKFYQYLEQFNLALHFYRLVADGMLCTGGFSKGFAHCSFPTIIHGYLGLALLFLWRGELRGEGGGNFLGVSCQYLQNFCFGGGLGTGLLIEGVQTLS